MSKKVLVIMGSVREGRVGDKVAEWVMGQLKKRTGVDYELVDLRDVDLPYMNEPFPPMMGNAPVHDHTKAWAKRISAADGFIFVTPEYNHGYSPALKNAIDYLYAEWREKPVAFVGYGSSGASEAIRQLTEVVEFIGMSPVSEKVGVSGIWEAFDENGDVKEDHLSGNVGSLAEALERVLVAKAAAVA